MTYTNDQLKAAFMDLLQNYAEDVIEFSEETRSYCGDSCPVIGACPFHNKANFDCYEEILKWYVENAQWNSEK